MKFYAVVWPAVAVSMAAISMFPLAANAGSLYKTCTAGGLCGAVETVSEAQMANVAGKFTVGGDVVGMRLMMLSSWQAANGQKLEAAATVAIRLPGHGHPGYASTQASAGGTGAPDIAGAANYSGAVQGSAGLNSINGVSQVIQVAGDGNGASNRTAVEISSATLKVPTGSGLSGATYKASNGSEAQVDIARNSMTLLLTMPDNGGTAQQNLNLANSGGIHQSIQIASSNQNVFNQMKLQIQVRPATNFGMAEQGLYHALSALHGR